MVLANPKYDACWPRGGGGKNDKFSSTPSYKINGRLKDPNVMEQRKFNGFQGKRAEKGSVKNPAKTTLSKASLQIYIRWSHIQDWYDMVG